MIGQADVLLAILAAEIISMLSIGQLDGPSLVCRVFGVVFQHRDNFIIELHPRVIWRLALIPVKAAVLAFDQPELNLRCRQGVHKGLHGAGVEVVILIRVVVGIVGRYTHDEVTRPRFISHKGITALVDVSFQIGNCIRCDSTRIVAGQNFNTVVSGGAGILVAVARLGPLHFITAIDVVVRVLHLAGLDVDFSRLGWLGAVQHVLIVVLDDLVGDVGNINVRVRTVRRFAELQHHSRSLVAGIGIIARAGIIENVGFLTVGLDIGRVCCGIPIRRSNASHPPQTVRCAVPTLCQSGQERNIGFVIVFIAYVQTVCFYFSRGRVPICLVVGLVTSLLIRFLPVTCYTVRFFCGQLTGIFLKEALAFTFGIFNIIVAVAGDILGTLAQIGNREPICTNRRKAVRDIGCFFRPRAIAAAADNSDFSATRKDCIKVSAAVNIYRNVVNSSLIPRADPCQNADCLRFCLDCTAIDAVDDVQRHNIGDLLHLDFTDNARAVICAV